MQKIISLALQEDVGSGDLSSDLIAEHTLAKAKVISRENAILAGQDYFAGVFKQIDGTVQIHWFAKDAEPINANQTICTLEGKASSILTAERCALNFLQTLSGTATTTHGYVKLIEGTKAKLLDTRKTLPGLRIAQKNAVRCGGGYNHRLGLYDAILIKDNHIAVAGSIIEAVNIAKQKHPNVFIEVEVETLEELQVALRVDVSRVMLDNFTDEQLKQAVALNNGRVELEASGNITKENIRQIAETGIDYISIGALTKNIKAIDFSMQFIL